MEKTTFILIALASYTLIALGCGGKSELIGKSNVVVKLETNPTGSAYSARLVPYGNNNTLALAFNTNILQSSLTDNHEAIAFNNRRYGLLEIGLNSRWYVSGVSANDSALRVDIERRGAIGTLLWSLFAAPDVGHRHNAGHRKTIWDWLRLIPYIKLIPAIGESWQTMKGDTGIEINGPGRSEIPHRWMVNGQSLKANSYRIEFNILD